MSNVGAVQGRGIFVVDVAALDRKPATRDQGSGAREFEVRGDWTCTARMDAEVCSAPPVCSDTTLVLPDDGCFAEMAVKAAMNL